MLTLILARARNGAIGLANGLPWHLPEDLAHFKRATMGATLLMGRRTWESIGRPLPGRTMVVLSRRSTVPTDLPLPTDAALPARPGSAPTAAAGREAPPSPAVHQAASLDEAIATYAADGRELFVIGGADLYRQALSKADRILLTEIDTEPEADTFFDASFADGWDTISEQAHVAADGTRLTWLDLRRRRAA